MECLCPPCLWNPTPCLFSRGLISALLSLSLTPFHPSISPSLPLYSLPSPSVTSPLAPSPFPMIHLRGFHMKMTSLTGHISMCHSASDATLQIFWRGSAPILLHFFFFFTLTAPPTSNTTRFCIPVHMRKKQWERQIDEENKREGGKWGHNRET